MKQESNRQRTMEGIDGGLHPAVDGQSLNERKTKGNKRKWGWTDTFTKQS